MRLDNTDKKKKLLQRLRRIEGQIRGIQAMVVDERNCTEILQQFSAASSALKSTSRVFFQDYASMCLAEMEISKSKKKNESRKDITEKVLSEMINLLEKTP